MSDGTSYLTDASIYLINLTFGIYITILLLRFLLQAVRADFYHPFSQALVAITQPVLGPIRAWIPSYGGIDWASILLMLMLQCAKIYLVSLIIGFPPALVGLLILAIAYLLKLTIYIYIVLLLVQVIISWLQLYNDMRTYSYINVLLNQLNAPLLNLVKRFIHPVAGGLDWSFLVIFVLLNLALIIPVAILEDIGRKLII